MKNYLLSASFLVLVSAAFAFSFNGNSLSNLFISSDTEISSEITYSAMIIANCPPATADPYIGGKVFKDIDMDGQNDANIDQAVPNVTITVFDLSGNQVGTATSETDGTYLVSSASLSASEKYRVEFSAWSDDYLPSFSGVNNASDIQFVTGSSCGVDFALTNPNDYCQSNPTIVTSCYAEGDQTSNTDVLVSFAYNNPTTVNHEAVANQIGTTYGLAYQRNSGKLFAASFMKRFAGFPAGNSPSSIYMISNPSNGATEAGLFVDLDDLSGAPANVAGADIHDFSLDPTSGEILDAAAFDAIGKYSFGDIDLASDELSIYAMNLFDRSIYQIPLGTDPQNPVAPTTFSELNIFPLIGNLPGLPAGITTNEIRPFALKVQGDVVYVGVVTSGQDGNIMQGLIYSFDIGSSTPAAPVFIKVLEFPLNYDRGCGFASPSGCAGPATWNKWEATHPEYPNNSAMPIFTSAGNALEEAHPQPMITDIEFDVAGNMIIGMRDRYGDQCGLNAPYPSGNQLKYPPTGDPIYINPSTGGVTLTPTSQGLYTSRQDAFGDILKATKAGSSWNLNIADHTDSSLSIGVSQAGILVCPDSENSFGEDCYHADGFLHEETAMGGLAVLLRNNQVVTPSMDPAQNAFSNGIDWFDASSGSLTQYFEVLTGANSPFGKAYGLGEIEFICDMPPVQIGNYVWQDDNNNGIQDANETGIGGVDVVLYKGTTPIATTETTADGSYYFSNQSAADPNLAWLAGGIDTKVLAETEYTVRIAKASGTNPQAALAGLSPSEANVNSNSTDRIDSDGVLSGTYVEATAMSGKPGEAKHSYDFGFSPCQTEIIASTITSCSTGNFTASISLDWTSAPTTGNLEYSVDGAAYQTLTRTNFSADATAELIEIPGLICNATKKISIRFEDTPDCFEELVFLFPPADPAGYFYCDNTGAIVTGGTISVTPPSGGSVAISDTGVDGYYSWVATGSPVTEGLYTMSYNPPPGYTVSGTPGGATGDTDNICDPSFGSEDNPSNNDPLLIGTTVNAGGTALDDFSAASNPYFLEFNLMLNDPFVDNNNIPLSGCANCNIQLSASSSSCVDDGDGTYSATLDVTVEWEDSPSPAEDIIVTLNGANAQNITTTAGSSGSQTIQFTIDADGSNLLLNAEFATTTSCSNVKSFKAPSPCVPDLGSNPGAICATAGATDIAGTVWEDYDYNGAMDESSIIGVAGIEVVLIDDCGASVATTYTDASGNYQFTGLTTGISYRIEFSLPESVSCWAKPTFAGVNGGTTVQFVEAGNCASLGIANPDNYCQQNPPIAAGCFVSGNIQWNSNTPVIVKYNYESGTTSQTNNSGKEVTETILATASQMGSVWGMAYNKTNDILYASAFMKMSAEFPSQTNGSNDPGKIYAINGALNGTPSVSTLTTLNAGTDPFPTGGTSGGGSWSEYQNGTIINSVGRIAFGDMDISINDEYLYVWNLFDKTLYELNSVDGSVSQTFSAPNLLGCDASNVIPGAVKYDSNTSKLLLGLTCSCETSGSNPNIYVYELDPSSGDMTEVLSVPMNYNRQRIGSVSNTGTVGAVNNWNCWSPTMDYVNWNDNNPPYYDNGTNLTYYPQPWLLDLELDSEGYLILAVSDRYGHQAGPGMPIGIGGFSAGDLLIAAPSTSGYTIENNGTVGSRTKGLTHTSPTDLGIGGTEFFYHDRFGVFNDGTNDDSQIAHSEIASGGLLILEGKSEVLVGAYDPAPLQDNANFGSGGVIYLSTMDGSRTRSAELYGPGAFPQYGKAAGIGDLEGLCELAPIQIGNLVWNDIDGDGIQDACEEGIDGVVVELIKDGAVIATTQTANGGQYYFSNSTATDANLVWTGTGANIEVLPEMSYTIRISNISGATPQSSLINLLLTTVNANSDNSDNIDNDATEINNNAEITFSTGESGCIIHELDFGFLPDCTILTLEIEQSGNTVSTICSGESIDLKITHSSNPGDMAIYQGPAGLTVTQLYDFANHGVNGITAVNTALSPVSSTSTMTSETGLTPTSETTYYAILANGNTFINDPDCLPFSEMTLPVFTQTPIATLVSDLQDLCSEDSPYVSGTENIVDLQSYITSGDTGGTWASTDAPASSLVGSVFTAIQAMEGTTYNFTYTIEGMTTALGLCDDNVYNLQIAVNDCYAAIGNYVWEDTNGNGVQDETGTEQSNIKVILFEAVSGVKGDMVTMTETNTNGEYLFDLLLPGEYAIQFDLPNSTNTSAADFLITGQNSTVASATAANNSDANPTDGCTAGYVLAAGDENLTVDAGLIKLASIGNYVWEDTNADGVQDEIGTGIENVLVILTGTDGLGNAVSETTNTLADGSYLFDDLVPGVYELTFETPADYIPTGKDDPSNNGIGDDTDDSDASIVDGTTGTTILISGEDDDTYDAGYFESASIGNFVFEDFNDNGAQDAGETGIEGVTIELTGTDGLGNPVTATTTTAADGTYIFEDLVPGEYNLTFTVPTDMQSSDLDATTPLGDDSDDSDADPANNWETAVTVLISAEDDDTWDAGFYATDFGDNPDSFGTEEGSNGAVHVISPGKYLGAGVDAELDGSATVQADGDDNNASTYNEGTVDASGNDDDGIVFNTPLIAGHEACITATATVSGNAPAYLTGWIDFNGDGTFSADEQLQFTAGADALIATGTTEYCFKVPANATFEGGETHARFRLSCETGVQPTGQVIGGEVEDYYIPLMKVGNLVWQDVDNEGDQDELDEYGLNDIVVHLTWAGEDNNFGTSDDVIFIDTTATENGVDGKYCFIGVTPGNYEISIPEYPTNFQQAPIDATGDDTTDNDGDNYQFTIVSADGQPIGENSTGDEPGNVFPDSQDDLTIDIALVAFDYGDLPDDFGTTIGNSGANHVLEPGLFLGVRVDAEMDGNPDPDAGVMHGGDNDGGAQDPITGTVASDEEGIEFLTPFIPGNPACIRVNGAIPSGEAYLKAWIDFNGDGDFIDDANEELIFMEVDATPITPTNEMAYGTGIISQKLTFMVPADATFDGGETHFRFRFGRDQDVSFTGEASGGEVEDYWRPLSKVGNLVWREYDEEGDQDEAAILGLDGVQVNLIYEGEDATIGTADDITYTTFTAPEEGVNGKYSFCGLTAGNYQVVLPTIPENMIVSPTEAIGNPILDADPLTVDLFIENAQALFPFENGMGDDAPSAFPTENDLLVIDFAFSALDFGDLPASFANTTDADNGAYHVINPSLYLGQGVDAEVDGSPENQAGTNGTGGDDQTVSTIQEGIVAATGSDEDGIEFISPIIPGEKAYVRVSTHAAANPAVLNAWVDYDGDGTFAADGSEQILWRGTDATTYAPTAEGIIPQGDNTQIMCFEVPEDAVFAGAETHVRVRLSSAGGLSPNDKALDGEVEDYYIPMVKVGNLVWRDLEINGVQDPIDLGMNDILIELTTEGPDGTIGTADDYVYQTTSATDVNGQDGHYQFCGLLAGDYTLTSYGDGSLPTISNEAGVAEDMDSDGVELVPDGPEVVAFTIVDAPVLNNQPTGENGIGDIPNDVNFPDANNNIEFDFGYQGLDYGDLPNTFVTLQQDGGASHVIIQDIFLGDRVDLDIDGAPTYESNGDNESPSAYTVGAATTTGNDEDGITFLTPLIPGKKATIQVKHTSTIGDALLNAWIDWNGDGLFAADGTEQLEWIIVDGNTIPPTKNGLLPTGTAITQDFCFNVPTDATFEGGETHIRVRMSTAGDLTPTGLTVNGEVEDYYLPLAKVGNVVWFDEDLYGDEDEAAQTGINDFPVELVYAGKDGILDTDDDILYTEITKNINGQDGSYYFCGLIDANYRLQYSEYPAGMISAIFDNTGNDFNDNDADFDFVSFAIENGAETNVLNENEVGDDTNPDNFPDIRTNVSVDFAFINMPRVGTSLSLQGVQEPTSETCGNFDAIYQSCIQNTGDTPLENIQAMFDFAAADMFGDAYVSLSVAPIILSDNTQETPQFSAAFDGSTAGKNLFDGTSGLLFPTEEICIQFTVELRPVAETAPPVMQIQSMVTGGAVNFDGTPIPDVLNGLPQFIADDLSDDGLLANDTNPESANDTGSVDDASALNDCFESNALACNDLVQISVDEMCSAGLTEDMVLENLDDACGIGALPLGGFYTVTLMNNLGQPIPNNEVTADMYGEELTVKVRHIVSCNDCWGQVIIEDKNAPEFDCPTDPIVVDCTDDLTAIAAPIAIDNCNANGVIVTLVNESTNDDDVCTAVIITREYTAIDEQGNQTEENCIQTIEIQPIDAVDFPEDVNWSCEEYAANPSITDATQAGSGIPNVSEGTYCNFGVTSSDEIVSVCSSTNTFKIIRTWTVLNWCTNSLVITDINGDDNIQIIKILDDVAPVITAESVALSTNVAGDHPQPCLSTGALPAAIITDNCSGVASVEIHTPIGTIFGNGGNIPEPGLGIGTHDVTYVATDGCGNTSELTVQVTIADDLTPTPVCEEITQVAIGGDGIATVAAETFDDGSNDNCGIDYFEVRRMTDNCAIAGNTIFGESVQFCCADIEATDIMVEFRVVDYYGNANSCMVQVIVEDKLAPIKLNNPADEAIDCDDYFVNIAPALDLAAANNETNPQILIDMFGEAIYDDNCEAIVTTDFIVNVNSCGQGTITRTWAATDPSGNIGQSCTQVITVNHVNDWNVQFPADVDLSCEAGQDELDGQDFGEPTIFDDDCELIAMSSDDQVFDVVEGACYQMIRTWTVINWCVYDGDNQSDDTIIGTRRLRDGNDGIITYQQQIRVTDEVAPVIANPGTQFHCIDTETDADGDCDMNIQLDEATVTDCSDDVTVTYAVTGLGTGRNYANVAPGIYEVIVTATDGCGNQTTITYDLDVRDCKAPIPYCVANLIIELMPMDEDGDGIPDAGMVEAWANDFNLGSFDNCTAEENLVYTATIGEDNFDASSSNLLFDCTTTGAQSIYVYVTDEAGNTDYCLTTVMIESVDNVCPEDPTPSDPIIAGAIMTEEGNGVELTEVHVNGATNSMEMTNEAGQHTTTVMQDGDYTVSPLRDDDHDNGVTTFDLVLIRQHVLNTNLLGSPYKLIAADANNSGSVTTSDIVLLRQLILTMIDELPANTSWRFVDAAYEFENPANPWATQFPEITNYNNVDADILDANFVGIKIGDVNGTAQANLTQDADERSTGEVIFRTRDADLIAGEEYSISLATVKELVGAQFTLDFDTDVLEFVALEEEMNAENFGLTKLERGAITVSVNDRQPTTVNCQLIFKALKDSKLSEVLNISSRFTKAEAYDTDDNLLDINLEFGTEENPTFVLLQNTPNPWSEKTTIGFNLPTATRAEIRIHDASGKTLRIIEQSFETGYNEVTLDGKGLGNQSILFYTIKTNTHSATKSMVRVK
jgi:hypothetical protein